MALWAKSGRTKKCLGSVGVI